MSHHDIDLWEARRGILCHLCDSFSGLIWPIEAILVVLVLKCPVVKLRLIWTPIDYKSCSFGKLQSVYPLLQINDASLLRQRTVMISIAFFLAPQDLCYAEDSTSNTLHREISRGFLQSRASILRRWLQVIFRTFLYQFKPPCSRNRGRLLSVWVGGILSRIGRYFLGNSKLRVSERMRKRVVTFGFSATSILIEEGLRKCDLEELFELCQLSKLHGRLKGVTEVHLRWCALLNEKKKRKENVRF